MDNGQQMFFTVKLRWTEFTREDWSSARFGELFLVPLVCQGGGVSTPPLLSPSTPFLQQVLPNGVLRVGTCPISHSLQLLGVVVEAEKYGYVRHKTWNAIMTAFPLDTSIFSVVLFCFSTFPVLWNNLECHYQWQVAPFILDYTHAEEESPHGRGGVFSWAGPLAQCRQ